MSRIIQEFESSSGGFRAGVRPIASVWYRQKRLLNIVAGVLVYFAGTLPLRAADPPPEPPRSSEAGVIDKRTFEGAIAELLEIERKKPEIEKPPEPEKPPSEGEAKFFVQEILLRGNETLPTERFRPFFGPYEGRELTLTESNRLAKQVEQEYREEGYFTTLAFVPPQRIEEGRLTLQVVEGKFGRLRIEGNRWFSQKTIRRYWRLKANQVLRYQDIEASIRRMNENADRTVQAVLRPGAETSQTDVYLKVKDRFPGHASFAFDDQGTRSTGRRRYGFSARHNNWLIPDSTLFTGTIFGKDFGTIYTQYLVPLNTHGTKFLAGFSYSGAAPKREFKGSDVHSRSTAYTLRLRQSLVDSERFASAASLGFDFRDSKTHDDTGLRRRDRMRVLQPGIDFIAYDTLGATSFSNLFSFGIRGLGASAENSPFAGRAGAPPDFFKYNGTMTRLFTLPFDLRTSFKLDVQLTPDKLIPADEMYLGGALSVRGYPEGDFLGDQGVLFSFELAAPFFFVPGDWVLPRSTLPLQKQIQLVFFFDEAYARLRGASQNEVKSRHLIGLGGGVRIRLWQNLSARLELGHALGDEPLTESDHTHFHFSLQAEV